MYFIFKKGSRQYRVQEGDMIDVDLLEAEKGSKITFEDVLFVGNDGDEAQVGAPGLQGYHVQCEVIGTTLGPKITSIKYRPSHNEVRKFGHRQRYTRVKVVSLSKNKQGQA